MSDVQRGAPAVVGPARTLSPLFSLRHNHRRLCVCATSFLLQPPDGASPPLAHNSCQKPGRVPKGCARAWIQLVGALCVARLQPLRPTAARVGRCQQGVNSVSTDGRTALHCTALHCTALHCTALQNAAAAPPERARVTCGRSRAAACRTPSRRRQRAVWEGTARAVSCIYFFYDNVIWACAVGILRSAKLPGHLRALQKGALRCCTLCAGSHRQAD